MPRFVLIFVFAAVAACARVPASPGSLEPEPEPPEPTAFTEEDLRELFRTPGDEDLAARIAEEERAAAELEARPGDLLREEIDPELVALGIDPRDFDLPIHINERVLFWKHYFRERIPDRFGLYLARMGRYEPMIRARLRERGMPEDLIYLALIESGFSPRAYSPAHAVGIWQFIAPTGRRYGLEVSPFVDERRDPLKATDAALDYLSDLYDRFGSWYLAAAAYNSGEGRVERLLGRLTNGRRGDDGIFWEIEHALPRETRNYVPKLVAATILGRHSDRFGFGHIRPHEAESFDVVSVPDATDLGVIADAAGVDATEIELLNPHFVRGYTPPNRSIDVRVPAGRGLTFTRAYALIPASERVRFIEHSVQRGETLSHISRRYGVSVADLQSANGIRDPRRLAIGRRLIVPRAGVRSGGTVASNARAASTTGASTSSARASGAATLTREVRYTVRRGDSLWLIARHHGVTINQIRSWNRLGNSHVIRPGQVLILRVPTRVVQYQVRPGDTLWTIARRHQVSVRQLQEWNNLGNSSIIRPGDRVEVRLDR